MKNKIVLLVTFLLLSSATIYAQGFRLGAKAGANLQQISGKSFSNGFKLGYQLGGFIELDFSKTLGIQPEVLFSQTNTNYANSLNQVLNVSTGDSINLRYLSIPILLRISAGRAVTFLIGPQYSIRIHKTNTLLENSQEAFKSGDFAMVAGLQFNLGILRIYGRYNIGMSNINEISNSDAWKTQQIQAGIGLKLISIQKKRK